MSSDTWLVLGALALGLVVLLLLVLLLHQPRVQLPPEWLARLQALEQAGLATQLAVAKNDGALDAMGQQLRAFTQTTQWESREQRAVNWQARWRRFAPNWWRPPVHWRPRA